MTAQREACRKMIGVLSKAMTVSPPRRRPPVRLARFFLLYPVYPGQPFKRRCSSLCAYIVCCREPVTHGHRLSGSCVGLGLHHAVCAAEGACCLLCAQVLNEVHNLPPDA